MTRSIIQVTLLSKALTVGAYQRKCALMAAHADIALTVLVPPAWGNTAPEPVPPQGYTLRVIPIRLNGNFHLHHYPTLSHELALSKPDILHIDEEPYNFATFLAFRLFHSLQRKLSTAAARPRPKALFFSWQNLARRYPPPFRWMERYVLRQADAAIVGNTEAQHVWRAKGFTKSMQVIPQFGVDEVAFAPTDAPKPPSFVIGYAGRLVSEKRVDMLIEALAALPTAQLLIFGDGPEAPALHAQAQRLGVLDRIEFRLPVPSTQMPAIYHAMHVLALPSETRPNWKEQFGRVLIEAMACGVPVIGSNSGEIPHVIGEAGSVFAERDGAKLTEALQLQQSPALCRDLAQRGRARVLERFTMQRIADTTVEFYRQLKTA